MLSRERLLEVSRELALQKPEHFALVAPLIRTTDMQAAQALAWPMICREFHQALEAKGYHAEAAILRALGLAHRAWRMEGMPMEQRVLFIEIVRYSVVANIFGAHLLRI